MKHTKIIFIMLLVCIISTQSCLAFYPVRKYSAKMPCGYINVDSQWQARKLEQKLSECQGDIVDNLMQAMKTRLGEIRSHIKNVYLNLDTSNGGTTTIINIIIQVTKSKKPKKEKKND